MQLSDTDIGTLDNLRKDASENDTGLEAIDDLLSADNALFAPQDISGLINRLTIATYRNKVKIKVNCRIRNKLVLLTPEEVVRQLWIDRLMHKFHYPATMTQVEYSIILGSTRKKADIVVLDLEDVTSVFMVIEVKKQDRKDGKAQLRSYSHATGAPIALWSNGLSEMVWNRRDPNHFVQIPGIPDVNQTIDEVAATPWTMSTLVEREKERAQSGITLRHLISDLEDEVLANAGVDVFEEVFKLLFIKMYDEVTAHENDDKLRFRNINTAQQLHNSLSRLFRCAVNRWPGVFEQQATIGLEPDHLQICVGTLESWKLFNSNLDILDDAFEYLVSKSSKGEKGQYFTPRWVIDMCVRMLNPREKESIVDPACGSAGFLIHSAFKVWKEIIRDLRMDVGHLFSADPKPARCRQYVRNKVFGIDFDQRVVRVARCINLIAGDGDTNILHLDSLDWKSWPSKARSDDWQDMYGSGWTGLRRFRTSPGAREYRNMTFDICFANPPYAGKVTQSRVLALYNLARSQSGKPRRKMDRDILFVERCIDLLKPGGRLAVVLPEGRFNNLNDAVVRDYILEQCRLLAVIALHSNSFKPHTGIRTGVLFVQKWNGDTESRHYCPRTDNYEVFFGVQQEMSVDNSGKKIYVRQDGRVLRDIHGHLIVKHDLFNHEGLTRDGLAEGFAEWATQQGVSFWSNGEYAGIAKFNSKAKCFTDNLKGIALHKRYDAQFYAPEHRELCEQLKAHASNVIRLGDILTFCERGPQPKYDPYGEVNVVRSGDIKNGYIDYTNLQRTSINALSKRHNGRLLPGDICLYTTGAGLGRTATYNAPNGRLAVASNHVCILRIRDHDPVYVAFVLNSTVGRQQTSRWSTGSAQAEIYDVHLQEIQIPLLPAADEDRLVKKLKQAELARCQSLEKLALLHDNFAIGFQSS
ncbi:MAG: N-6 DNA methylase [Bacteroidota bacterium]|nr:N-6 DNA methylase [Bacteroidota bacterium]